MMNIKSIKMLFYDIGMGRVLCSLLVDSIKSALFIRTIQNELTIAYLRAELDESFSKCVVSALDLIEEFNPAMSRVVTKNLRYIVGERASRQWLAKYHRNLHGCVVNWDEMENYNVAVRDQIMAGVIVHEAYHGECYRIYGCKAYDIEPIEKICRRREMRMLNHFIHPCSQKKHTELKRRIRMLKVLPTKLISERVQVLRSEF